MFDLSQRLAAFAAETAPRLYHGLTAGTAELRGRHPFSALGAEGVPGGQRRAAAAAKPGALPRRGGGMDRFLHHAGQHRAQGRAHADPGGSAASAQVLGTIINPPNSGPIALPKEENAFKIP